MHLEMFKDPKRFGGVTLAFDLGQESFSFANDR
jgi:hypothetical protein